MHTFDGTFKRDNPPIENVFVKYFERGLVELNYIDTGFYQIAGFPTQNSCKCHRHIRTITEMSVGKGVANRHWAG